MVIPLDEQLNTSDLLKMQGGWVNVKVASGPLEGESGWIASAALGDDALKKFEYGDGATGFTGTTYGFYPVTYGSENPNPVIWQDNCPICGEAWELHTLKETTTLKGFQARKHGTNPGLGELQWTNPNADRGRENSVDRPRRVGTEHDCKVLYEALSVLGCGKMEQTSFEAVEKTDFAKLAKAIRAKYPSGPGQPTRPESNASGWGSSAQSCAQVMIGVLHVAESDTVYAAFSGPERVGFVEVCEYLGFRPAPVLKNDAKLLTRGGEPLPSRYIDGQIIQNYKCAAPRMIQAAVKDGEYPYAITEIWYDPGSKSATGYDKYHTIESCDQCRGNVPFMLCP